MSYQDLLLDEIREVPEEHLPALLAIIQRFRRSVTSGHKGDEHAWEELRGSVLFYEAPFEPAVDVNDWEIHRDYDDPQLRSSSERGSRSPRLQIHRDDDRQSRRGLAQ